MVVTEISKNRIPYLSEALSSHPGTAHLDTESGPGLPEAWLKHHLALCMLHHEGLDKKLKIIQIFQ